MSKKMKKIQSVVLDHAQPLGSGYYGNTYQAHCDHLLCAGKHMTPELFESEREGSWGSSKGGRIKKSLIASFQQEIESLRRICHPHLVQYLGTHIESSSNLPILLMELCHDNLTAFLDKSYETLVYHKQVSLLHNIILALAFLHTHDIVHGNLSSNNVFVVPYEVPLAKVSDYGICRMPSIAKHNSTYYRGNTAYLPPDPLSCLQRNTKKVDCYSWGVLATQVLTNQLPLPPPKQANAGSTESSDHHKAVLDLVDSSHPLLPIVKSSLRLMENHRPPSDIINFNLAELKAEKKYAESVQQHKKAGPSELAQVREELRQSRVEVERLTKELAAKSRDMAPPRSAQKEATQKKAIKRLNCHFDEDDKQDNKPLTPRTNTFENAVGLNLQGEEKSSYSPSNEREQGDGLEMTANQGVETVGGACAAKNIVQMREKKENPSPLLQTGSLGNPKKRRWSLLRKSNTVPDMLSCSSPGPSLTVRVGTSALSPMVRGYVAVDGNGKAYFTSFSSSEKRIYTCKILQNLKSLSWMVIRECPHFEFGLVIVNDAVTAVGGYTQEYRPSQPTNCLLTYSEARQQWTERFPPMNNKRRLPAVVTTPTLLVVAGGHGERNEVLATVEVMNLQTQQWSSAEPLPMPLTHASATLHEDSVHIAGGQGVEGPTQVHFTSTISRSSGMSNKEKLSPWKKSYKTPTLWCTLTSLGGHLFAVGGQDDHKNCSSAIFMYDPTYDVWVKAGSMRCKRSACLVAVPCGADGGVMLVAGGFVRKNEMTNAAEIITCMSS